MNRRASLKLITGAAISLFLKPRSAGALADFTGGAPPAQEASLPAEPIFSWLQVGAVKPTGWIRAQMLRDLNEGFAGCLGGLCHEASSDIFVTNRNSLHSQNVANRNASHGGTARAKVTGGQASS